MRLSEIAFFTDDVAGMTAFYGGLLGIAPEYESPGLVIFAYPGLQILIHRTYVPGPGDLPPEDHIAFSVSDLVAACQGLEAVGLRIETPPREYEWGRSAYLRDPDGHLIELQQA